MVPTNYFLVCYDFFIFVFAKNPPAIRAACCFVLQGEYKIGRREFGESRFAQQIGCGSFYELVRCLSLYSVPHTSHFQTVVSFMIFSSCYRLYWHGQEDFSEKNSLTRHPSPQSSGIPQRTPSPLSRTAAGNGRPGATGDPYPKA